MVAQDWQRFSWHRRQYDVAELIFVAPLSALYLHRSHSVDWTSALVSSRMRSILSTKKFRGSPASPSSGMAHCFLHNGHVISSPGRLPLLQPSTHYRQKVWTQGRTLGSLKTLVQMEHSVMSSICFSAAAILENIDLPYRKRHDYEYCHLHGWIGLCSVLRPHQHSIGYTGDGFHRSKRPNQQYQSTEGKSRKENNPANKENTKYTCIHTKW